MQSYQNLCHENPLDPWFKTEQYNRSYGQPYFDLLKREGLFQKHIDTTHFTIRNNMARIGIKIT